MTDIVNAWAELPTLQEIRGNDEVGVRVILEI
jgi:hypothetical protein